MSLDKGNMAFMADLDAQVEKLRRCEVLTEEQVSEMHALPPWWDPPRASSYANQ